MALPESAFYFQMMRDQLSQNVEGRFWKGKDVKVLATTTVEKAASVPIIIDHNALPPLINLPTDAIAELYASTRSRLIQLGLEVDESVGRFVAGLIRDRNSTREIECPIIAEAIVYNHGARPITVEEGIDLFRFYHPPNARMSGRALEALFENGDIKIDGEQGIDWNFIRTDNYSGEEELIGVAVKIESEDRYWIPPDPNNTPISTREVLEAQDYRNIINTSFFEPIPQLERTVFWIGKTKKVSLSDKVEAELDSRVFPSLHKSGFVVHNGIQVNSRLIDGGKTDWPVIVEILSPTTEDQIANFAVFFFHDAGLAQAA